jgi:hypothetical protein
VYEPAVAKKGPVANVSLALLSGDMRSQTLKSALLRFQSRFGITVRITTRLMIEHPRIAKEYCVVICRMNARKAILATMADLVDETVAALCKDARIYEVGTERKIKFRASVAEESEEDKNPPGAVLFLLAFLGSALTYQQQVEVIGAEDNVHMLRDLHSEQIASAKVSISTYKLYVWMQADMNPFMRDAFLHTYRGITSEEKELEYYIANNKRLADSYFGTPRSGAVRKKGRYV